MRNFIFKQVFLLSLTFFYACSVKAQTLTANCSSVTLNITYPEVFIPNLAQMSSCGGNNANNPCCKFTNQSLFEIVPKTSLMQKQLNGTFKSLGTIGPFKDSGYNLSSFLSNLSHGTYRVDITAMPSKATTPDCPNGLRINTVTIVKDLGVSKTVSISTNEVVVGATVPGEVQYSYIDPSNGMPNGWDKNEAMRISTINSKNYDRWWLAIIEQGGANRYKSLGWTFGKMPTEIDLKAIWAKDDVNWKFEQGTHYYIQLAAMTGCNSSWVEATNPSSSSNTFFVCGENWGCKGVSNYTNMILSPNPATNTFRISNVDNIDDHSLTLTDMSGRMVKAYSNISNEELDIAELPTGMYMVHLWNGAKRMQTTKLSVVK